jgi:hypothetical protein
VPGKAEESRSAETADRSRLAVSALYPRRTIAAAGSENWRMVNAPHLVALVRAGATFINGKIVERPGEEAQPEAAQKDLDPQGRRSGPPQPPGSGQGSGCTGEETTSSPRKGRGARQRPAKPAVYRCGIPATGSDVRQLAPPDARDSVIPHMSHRAWPAVMPSGTGSDLRLRVTFCWCERTQAAPQRPVLVRLDGMSQ